MKLMIDKEIFLQGINRVTGVISSKSTLPILANILLESEGGDLLRLSATDLEVGISCTTPANLIEEGSVTVPGKKLQEIIRELPPGEIELSVAKNNSITIKTDKTVFKIVGLAKDDFPKLPNFSLSGATELDCSVLKECLNLTTFAVCHDESRYILNGALLIVKDKKLKIVTTDGRRLALIQKDIKTPPPEPIEVIIPTKTTQELNKILNTEGTIKIILLKNQIIFSLKDTFIISRLIEGHFPNYEQVIPTEEKTISTIDRDLLLSAVRRASLLTTPESQSVKLDLLKDKLLISAKSPNLGEVKEEIEAERRGEDLIIGFNPHYLIDVLKNLDIEKVSLALSGTDKPGVVKGKEGYVYVIMPMQLS